MAVLKDLAKEIWECEFDSTESFNSLQSIECWLETNLGLLNTMINTSYCLEDPNLDSEAQAVYKQLYLYKYYSKRTRNALRGIVECSGDFSGDIASISDGESRVKLNNKNETAKVMRGIANDAKAALDMLASQYNMYQSEPRQVTGIEALD